MGISLRILLTVMILIMTLAAALIAFLPTYLSGVAAVDSTVADIRQSFLIRVNSSIDDYLSAPLAQLDLIYNFYHTALLQNETNSNATARLRFVLELTASDPSFSTAALGFLPNFGASYDYSDQDIDSQYPHAGQMTILPNGTSFLFTQGYSDIKSLTTIQTLYTGLYDLQYDFVMGPLTDLETRNPAIAALPAPRLGFMGISSGLDQPLIASFVELLNPSGEQIGFLTINTRFDAFTSLLTSLGLRQRSAAVAYSIFPEKVIYGNSWGEKSFSLSPNFIDYDLPEHIRLPKRYFNNLTAGGYVTSEVIPALGLQQLEAESFPFTTIIDTKEYGKTYIDIIGVEKPGLKLRVLLVIPEVDFMEGINQSRTAALAGTISAIALTVGLAFIFAHLITAPLVRLQERMELAARFQDDGSNDDAKSFMSEVALMQSGYEGMRDELNRAKPYLPQSVLQRGDSEDDDEDEGGVISRDGVSSAAAGQIRPGYADTEHSRTSGSADQRSASRSTAYDQRSHRSATSSRNLRAAATLGGAVGLNTANSAISKRVSLLVFNLRGFHDKTSSPSQLLNLQKRQLTCVSKHVKENRGVIDFFQGDRIQCSFNAVSSCNVHQRRALTAAVGVVTELEQDAHCPGVTVGMASGNAIVGNMGNEEMRRFCIVGHIVQQAHMLERLNKNYETRLLVAESAVQDVANEFVLRAVDIVRLPRARTEAPLSICEVLGSSLGAGGGDKDDGEWMYQLEKLGQEESNPFNKVNLAFKAVLEGEKDQAMSLLAAVTSSQENNTSSGDRKSSDDCEGAGNNDSPPLRSSNSFQLPLAAGLSVKKLNEDSVTRVTEILNRLESNPSADLHQPLGWYDRTLF